MLSQIRAAIIANGGTPTKFSPIYAMRELVSAYGGTPTQYTMIGLLREAVAASGGTPTKFDEIGLLRQLLTARGVTATSFDGKVLWGQVASGGGAAVPVLGTLTLSGTLTNGTASSGTIIGATTSSTITSNVTGLAVNSGARTYSWDGTGAAGTTANGLVETLAGATGSPKNNSVTVGAGVAVYRNFAGGMMVPGVVLTALTSGSVDSGNSWVPVANRAGKTVSKVKVLFTGWYSANPIDVICPNAYTVKVSLEYPIGATPQLFTFSGTSSGTVNPGENVLSDELVLTTPIPKDALFRIRTYTTVGSGLKWPLNRVAAGDKGTSSSNGEQGTGLTDKTTGTTAPSTFLNYLMPSAILCEDPVGAETVAIVGDSIGAGQQGSNDYTNLDPNYGGSATAYQGRPIINTSRPSQSPDQQTLTNLAYKIDFFKKAGVTLVHSEHGTNAATGGATAFNSTKAMLDVFAAQGFKVVQETMLIKTNAPSTPRLRFDASATTPLDAAGVNAFNALVRAKPSPMLAYIETNIGYCESGTYPGNWADYIHDGRSQLSPPQTFTVAAGSSTTVINTTTSVGSNNFWNNGGGAVEFLTGALAGQWFDPTLNSSTTVTVGSAMPSAPVAGDTIRLHVPRNGGTVGDGLHPSNGGHKIKRDAVKAWIDSYFAALVP